jgi:hypothetical protein
VAGSLEAKDRHVNWRHARTGRIDLAPSPVSRISRDKTPCDAVFADPNNSRDFIGEICAASLLMMNRCHARGRTWDHA